MHCSSRTSHPEGASPAPMRPQRFGGHCHQLKQERKMKPIRFLTACNGVALLLVSGWAPSARAQGPSANVSVFATGLNNPRGLKFGPDGNLYVAEGGMGGTTS